MVGSGGKRGPRGFREATVRAATGKWSPEWYRILDRWGAAKKGHTASARYLLERHRVDPWWSQALTVRYEYERGLRSARLTVPGDVRRALAKSPRARAIFERLAPSHRREYVEWIQEAKRPETRARRLTQAVARILAGRPEPT